MSRKKKNRPFDLERALGGYLKRYDTSRGHLKWIMMRRARKYDADLAEVEPELERRLDRLEASGLLDDRRYADSVVRLGRRRGQSSRQIRSKLFKKRVPRDVIDAALSDPDADLRAAAAYVRKKRLGAHRRGPADRELEQKELARLARRGFSYQVAKQVLQMTVDELEEAERED